MAASERTGAYPGTFNPLTRAHLEIAAAARAAHALDRIDLIVSKVALGKEAVDRPRFDDRIRVLRADATDHDWLDVVVTELRLIVEIAAGYDVVIMGADKWAQVNDASWYESGVARDEAVAALPTPAVAPRSSHSVPEHLALPVSSELVEISSTSARAGRRDLMAPAARRFDLETGAWTDPDRYEAWRRTLRG